MQAVLQCGYGNFCAQAYTSLNDQLLPRATAVLEQTEQVVGAIQLQAELSGYELFGIAQTKTKDVLIVDTVLVGVVEGLSVTWNIGGIFIHGCLVRRNC
jgi:hypothetical protein